MAVFWTLALNLTLGFGADFVGRFGAGQKSGSPRFLGAVVVGWAWLTVGMQLLGSVGWLARGPLLGWSICLLLVGLGLWFSRGRGLTEENKPSPREGGRWLETGTVGLLLWAGAILGGPSLLRPVKVVSDGPIYHLYFAARWWQAERLLLVAAPFGENAATYFPAGGDLWFSWLMIAWGGDSLAKVGQVPFLAVAGLATVALARSLGAGRSAAVVATSWFLASSPLLLYAFEPNVDTIFNAGYLTATYFFIRFALGEDGVPSLVLGALAAGLALGTKAPAVVFVPPLILFGMLLALLRATSTPGKIGLATIAALVPFSVAGFWYARNAILTGNPLYPLHLEIARKVWLQGWYGPEVMKQSPYYLPMDAWRACGDILVAVLDPRLAPFWLASLLGIWRVRAPSRRAVDRWVWLLSGLAVLNFLLYWLLIPYRTQQRFFLQALGLAAIPLARMLDRACWARVIGLGLLAIHLLTRQTWPMRPGSPPWDLSSLIPNEIPGVISLLDHPSTWIAPLSLGALSALVAWAWFRPSPGWKSIALAGGLTGVYLGVAAAIFYPWQADARRRFYPMFPEYYRGWLEFDGRCGPKGARVAYAGTDLPFYLMGVGLRNEVRYVNVDAHPSWLLHDYQRHALASGNGPGTWPNPRPGWDRIHPDYESWLSNLRAQSIQLLVVTRANPSEGPHNIADRSGFPIERVWADRHPESFEMLYGEAENDPQFRLYRLKLPST